MNKLYALFIVTIIIGCDSSRNLSIESLIENKDLDELKKRKKEYVDQMNIMKVELNEINNGISFLDENERLTLVSDYEIKPQEFNSYIETQAEVIQKLNDYQLANKSLSVNEQNMNLAISIEDKNSIKFFEGLVSSFELRQAQIQLLDSQQKYLNSVIELISIKTELETLYNN